MKQWPPAEYYVDRTHSDGLSSQCKECKRAAGRAYRKRNLEKCRQRDRDRYPDRKEKVLAYHREYHAVNRERLNAASSEYRRNNLDQLRAYDRNRYVQDPKRRADCNRRSKRHYLLNRNAELERRKQWACENRALKAALNEAYELRKQTQTIGDSPTKQAIADRMTALGNRCAYCGGPFEHVEHLKPLSLGGPHCLANLRPSCRRCNAEKFTTPPKAWLARCRNRNR
jgi:hypothetical protein